MSQIRIYEITGINTRHLQSKSVIATRGVGFQVFICEIWCVIALFAYPIPKSRHGISRGLACHLTNCIWSKRTCYIETANAYFDVHAQFAERLYTKLSQKINGRCSAVSFVPRGSIINMPSLVQIRAWCRLADKRLSEPMMALFNDAYIRH